MSLRLRIVGQHHGLPVAAEITLPTRARSFALTPLGARQLGERLIRLADMMDREDQVEGRAP